jgi:hypothetical protein
MPPSMPNLARADAGGEGWNRIHWPTIRWIAETTAPTAELMAPAHQSGLMATILRTLDAIIER